MRQAAYMLVFLFTFGESHGQQAQKDILQGNRSYREGKFDEAAASYRRALSKSPENPIASFNLGNAFVKTENPAEAEKAYDAAISNGRNDVERSVAWYNKGVSLSRQGKTEESIVAYKQALRINPMDTLARENLVRAMREKKRKEQKEEEEKRQKEEDGRKESPPPPMNPRQMQHLLQALQEQEKQLRQKIQKTKAAAPAQPEKDW